jgi:hypothetical protein
MWSVFIIICSYGVCFGAAPLLELAAESDLNQAITDVNVVAGYLSYGDLSYDIPSKFSEYDAAKVLQGVKDFDGYPELYWIHTMNDPLVPLDRIKSQLRKVVGEKDIYLLGLPTPVPMHIPPYTVAGEALALLKKYASFARVENDNVEIPEFDTITKIEEKKKEDNKKTHKCCN